jgi:NAD(P)-dependent dehydrogenase (short-subunit alcohol dehydrogenase family)
MPEAEIPRTVRDAFDLTGRVVVITGGAGLMGVRHANGVAGVGGIPVMLDIDGEGAKRSAGDASVAHSVRSLGMRCDITDPADIKQALDMTLAEFGRVDVLINNAAIDPKVDESGEVEAATRLEQMPLADWDLQVRVGLTGAFLCCQTFGSHMAAHGGGVILNIASDLGVVAPDQRIYRVEGKSESHQPVKPITYSVIKTGLIGMTRYLATYWADQGVRANAISPGGVYTDQPDDFVDRLTNLIPMGRMARLDEYEAAVVFLVSDASAYMTGTNLVIDGGRTAW